MKAADMIRTASLMVSLTFLAGCPPRLCVRVPNTSAQNFTIEVGEDDDCEEPAPITRLVVRRVSDGKVFWNLGSTTGVEVSTVQYGEEPAGLDEGLPAQPLTPGERVNVTVDGRGASGGVDVTVTE